MASDELDRSVLKSLAPCRLSETDLAAVIVLAASPKLSGGHVGVRAG